MTMPRAATYLHRCTRSLVAMSARQRFVCVSVEINNSVALRLRLFMRTVLSVKLCGTLEIRPAQRFVVTCRPTARCL